MTLEEDTEVVLSGLALEGTVTEQSNMEVNVQRFVERFPAARELIIQRLPSLRAASQVSVLSLFRGHLAARRDWSATISQLLLNSPEPSVQESAASLLGECTDHLHARDALLHAATTSGQADVRRGSVFSLRRAADLPEVRQVLREISRKDGNIDVRRMAITSLTDEQVLSRLGQDSNTSPIRLDVVPAGETRELALTLLSEIRASIAKIRDFAPLSIEQNRILDVEVVPRVEALERLVGGSAPTIDEVRPARLSSLQLTLLAAGALGGLTQTLAEAPAAINSAQAAAGHLVEFGNLVLGLILP